MFTACLIVALVFAVLAVVLKRWELGLAALIAVIIGLLLGR